MSNKLFVGGLSWGTDDHSLRASFEQYGEVHHAKVILDRNTGKSRGFGFVTFGADESAKEAMNGMNGNELDGRMIRVNFAEEREFGNKNGSRQDFSSNSREQKYSESFDSHKN